MKLEPTLFAASAPGRDAWSLPELDVPPVEPGFATRFSLPLPELSESDIARHYTRLSVLNHHVDKGFYPLGSCTMKYNPKVNERAARLSGLADIHPLQPDSTAQGALQLMHELAEFLKAITGFRAVTLNPAAGAHGELTGMMIVRKYFSARGEPGRNVVLVPDSAHGTNPASVTLAGLKAVQIRSKPDGRLDPAELERACNSCVACLMLTNPNTLGIFESDVRRICDVMHAQGALVYLDGANLNSYLGIHRPADAGIDLMHINLHKTFSTPHGGGGPGSGPVAVCQKLEPLLPVPRVVGDGSGYRLELDCPDSIGRVMGFHGQFGVMVRAWTYIRMLGASGLTDAARMAVLNANYVRSALEQSYALPVASPSLHEVVFSGTNLRPHGVRTLDVAKRLLDFGFHAPTIYFPLIVPEALMIEPTETESRETLDAFIAAMKQIAIEAAANPDTLRQAPVSTPVGRLDEARASRELDVCQS
jgi:glycine dehydrogenase subunit 2